MHKTFDLVIGVTYPGNCRVYEFTVPTMMLAESRRGCLQLGDLVYTHGMDSIARVVSIGQPQGFKGKLKPIFSIVKPVTQKEAVQALQHIKPWLPYLEVVQVLDPAGNVIGAKTLMGSSHVASVVASLRATATALEKLQDRVWE